MMNPQIGKFYIRLLTTHTEKFRMGEKEPFLVLDYIDRGGNTFDVTIMSKYGIGLAKGCYIIYFEEII